MNNTTIALWFFGAFIIGLIMFFAWLFEENEYQVKEFKRALREAHEKEVEAQRKILNERAEEWTKDGNNV